MEFSVTPQPILQPGASAKLLCTTEYEILHSAEIYDTSHNDTLALSHGERPLRLAVVVPSQVLSHTCYMCVAKDHSGTLLAKENLCVEVVAGDGKRRACMHHNNCTYCIPNSYTCMHAIYITSLTTNIRMATTRGVLE